MKLIRALSLCLALKVVLSFPESGDPITEEPKLNRPNTETYVATIFENAPCSSWDLILTSQYTPPPSSSWSRVILDFSVSLSHLDNFLFGLAFFTFCFTVNRKFPGK